MTQAAETMRGVDVSHHRRWSRFADATASMLIGVGGIGTIVALLLVVLVLVATVFPLLQPARFGEWTQVEMQATGHYAVDDQQTLCWAWTSAGTVEVRDLLDGRVLAVHRPPDIEASSVTSSCLSIDRNWLTLGREDGTYVTAQLQFEESLLDLASIPAEVSVSQSNPVQYVGEAAYQWFDDMGVRRIRLAPIKWSKPAKLCDGPVLAIDMVPHSSSVPLVRQSDHSLMGLCRITDSECQLVVAKSAMAPAGLAEIPSAQDTAPLRTRIRSRNAADRPLRIMFLGREEHALVLWPNGILDRYAIGAGLRLVESQNAVLSQRLLCAAPLLGRQTLLCGTNDGEIRGWMLSNRGSSPEGPEISKDQFRLNLSHIIKLGDSPITSLTSSQQTQLVLAADEESDVSLILPTTNSRLATSAIKLAPGVSGSDVELAFDATGTVALASAGPVLLRSQMDIGHPQASWQSYFAKVWYEGHAEPAFIWQSTTANEEAETKLSLIPLLFGSLKATFFAMLFSAPIALLAAIYCSEFLGVSMRARVKPTLELMASVPGVVLGFLAAIILRPIMEERWLTAILACYCLPVFLAAMGYLWSAAQVRKSAALVKLLLMLACIPCAWWVCQGFALICNQFLFNGSFSQWILTGEGPATGGWMLLLIPLLFVPIGLTWAWLTPRRQLAFQSHFPVHAGLWGLLEMLCLCALLVCLAWIAGRILSSWDLDPRDFLFTGYQDANALLVGATLGFCVIPLIFTLADDALQAVSQDQRSASVACGATRWQTTTRIVLPAARSGLISAVMIGFSRAAGETMIVLMVVGQTPLMDWNPFSGLKAITATLATELTEAGKGGTHFRTLFLAALMIFAITLAINTLAEFIRTRSSKDAMTP